ncbi:hypothetical protein FA15DRAFT_669248 [Coprinopsis marcescibilis]|uniref:Uncharacterized protein n=1 Tax=Coprinopsis marcescibilis TaxID=230819 RepID=A0A5C3KWZ7_COPMA|nr:hypothetical protein FA15DRAFT_669248 [Coprinopsis marcescibilis]
MSYPVIYIGLLLACALAVLSGFQHGDMASGCCQSSVQSKHRGCLGLWHEEQQMLQQVAKCKPTCPDDILL